ncbi:MAG: hypothetical protein ACJ735_02085 [Actinomycetes bacterium]
MRHRRVGRVGRLAAAAVLVTVGLGAAACGSGGKSSSAADPWQLVVASPQKTTDARSANFSINLVTKALGQSFTLTGTGAFDFAKHAGAIHFTLPASLGGRTISEIVTTNTLYLQLPPATPPGKYAAIKVSDLTGDGSLAQLGNSDPTTALETLRGASHDVRKVGTATVRGTQTTHYRGTIDVQAAINAAPEFLREKVRRVFGRLTSLPYDAYLDDQGRLRRFDQRLTLPATSDTGNQPVDVTSTFELFDFGTTVNAAPPPASKTVDGSSLLQQLMRRS